MEEGVVVANFPIKFPPTGFPFSLPYEPIVLPDNSTRVVGTSRDQATISLDRAILPVEAEPPNPFGQRVYIDTQATAEPKNAAMEQAITEGMIASRYEEGNAEPRTPPAIDIVGVRTGGVLLPLPLTLGASPTVVAARYALKEKVDLLFNWAEPRLSTFSPAQIKLLADLEAELKSVFNQAGAIPDEQWLALAQKASSDIDAVQAALTSTASTSWLLIGGVAVGAWLLLRK